MRAAACITRQFRWRSFASWHAIDAGTAATSCTSASSCCSRRSPASRSEEYDLSLTPGASFSAVDPYNRTWTFTSQGVSRYEELNRQVTAVVLEAKRAGMAPTLIKSEKRQHVDSRGQPTFEPSTEVGILESLRQDVYLVLHGVSGDEKETAEIRITFNPLVWWVWYGGIIMAIGGLIVMWPQATRAGAKRRAEGGYVVVMQPTERRAVEAPKPPVEAGV